MSKRAKPEGFPLGGEGLLACVICGLRLQRILPAALPLTVGVEVFRGLPWRLHLVHPHHRQHFDEVPPEELARFLQAAQAASRALRGLPGVKEVKVTLLGEKVGHLQARLTPRLHRRHEGEDLVEVLVARLQDPLVIFPQKSS